MGSNLVKVREITGPRLARHYFQSIDFIFQQKGGETDEKNYVVVHGAFNFCGDGSDIDRRCAKRRSETSAMRWPARSMPALNGLLLYFDFLQRECWNQDVSPDSFTLVYP